MGALPGTLSEREVSLACAYEVASMGVNHSRAETLFDEYDGCLLGGRIRLGVSCLVFVVSDLVSVVYRAVYRFSSLSFLVLV